MDRSPNTRMFNLTGYFSVLSLLLIVVAGVVLGSYFQNFSTHHLISQAEQDNVSMARFVHNALHEDFSAIVTSSYVAKNQDQIHASATGLLPAVLALIRKSDVIKVKVYNRNGLTVFSSDLKQVGADMRHKPGFQSAIRGEVSSYLQTRDVLTAHEGERANIDFIASYMPMHGADGSVLGVFEIYREVTPLVRRVNSTLWQVAIAATLALALLYLLQLLVVRHAQRVLRQQAQELESMNLKLDRRVEERTCALEAEIAERLHAEKQLDHLAYHDPLTGLPNRLMFKAHLTQSLLRIARQKTQLAVLFIDLDRFKDVNDTLGHSIGDDLLVAVTQRIKTCVRTSDTLARHGGDEFICILETMAEPDDARLVAEKLLALFHQPFSVRGNELYLSASIGISLAPDDGTEVEILVRNADAAMYQAKAGGRNRFHFYTPEMTREAQDRVRIETLLRHAIKTSELAVHFQPKVDANTTLLTGAEALLRWNSHELGSVPPARFIPLAEGSGLIVELGAWVLRETCRQVAAWDAEGFFVPKVSINLSVKQLERGDFLEQVRDILHATGIDPVRIEFEITESIIMSVDDSLAMLNALRTLGVSLSVDDFGTGYSSLAYLRDLPIQTLKIDRSFICGIGVNPGDEAIIRTVIELAHSFGFTTVAEGVETPHQARFLCNISCDQIQGFLYGKAVAESDFRSRWQTAANNQDVLAANLSAAAFDRI